MTTPRRTRDQWLNAQRGEARHNAVLTETDVRYIRRRRRQLTQRQIAGLLGVHRRTVEKVATYETWAHVR